MKGIQGVKELIIYHEKLRLKPYKCPAGKLTIGIGRNLEDRGISRREALFLFEEDVRQSLVECYSNFDFWHDLDGVRQAVLLDMCFNLGITKLLEFKQTLQFVREKKYKEAAEQMLKSRWAKQVGDRAQRLAQMMETGEWPTIPS